MHTDWIRLRTGSRNSKNKLASIQPQKYLQCGAAFSLRSICSAGQGLTAVAAVATAAEGAEIDMSRMLAVTD